MKRHATYSKSRAKTLSFVCKVPLRVTAVQERQLLTRFEAARQLYNAVLGEALRRLRLLRQSTLYQAARRDIPRGHGLRAAFAISQKAVGFTAASLSQYATHIHHSWIGDHVDAVIGQTLTKRAFQAANKLAWGQAQKVRFKGRRGLHQIGSLEAKSTQAGLRWRNTALHWGSWVLPMVAGADRDPVIAYGLAHRVKYVRLVRRTVRGRLRWCAKDSPCGNWTQRQGNFVTPTVRRFRGCHWFLHDFHGE